MKRTNAVRVYAAAFMLVTGGIAYQSFTVPVRSATPEVQETLYRNVPHAIPGPPPRAQAVEHGKALAYIRIPRFGKDWLWSVLEGTGLDVLDQGPGHFTGTALPGEVGNTAYAAHRSGHGDPFLDFETLRPGDEIVLAQGGAEWTYVVTKSPHIIEPSEGRVVKNMQSGHWLTLTTCWPKYGSEKRMFVRARLDK